MFVQNQMLLAARCPFFGNAGTKKGNRGCSQANTYMEHSGVAANEQRGLCEDRCRFSKGGAAGEVKPPGMFNQRRSGCLVFLATDHDNSIPLLFQGNSHLTKTSSSPSPFRDAGPGKENDKGLISQWRKQLMGPLLRNGGYRKEGGIHWGGLADTKRGQQAKKAVGLVIIMGIGDCMVKEPGPFIGPKTNEVGSAGQPGNHRCKPVILFGVDDQIGFKAEGSLELTQHIVSQHVVYSGNQRKNSGISSFRQDDELR